MWKSSNVDLWGRIRKARRERKQRARGRHVVRDPYTNENAGRHTNAQTDTSVAIMSRPGTAQANICMLEDKTRVPYDFFSERQ